MEAGDLVTTIRATRPMVPAKDFVTSKQFYCYFGFQSKILTKDLAEMILDSCSFLFQNYCVRDWADNFFIDLYVSDLQPWWDHIVAAGVATRYRVKTRAPHRADWGAPVAQMIDPAGVLWRFHEAPPEPPAA